MTYDRAAIMRDAWAAAREAMRALGYAAHQLRAVFAFHLRAAWAKARRAVHLSRRSAAALAAAIVSQKNADRLGALGLDALDELRRAHRAAVAREAAGAAPGLDPVAHRAVGVAPRPEPIARERRTTGRTIPAGAAVPAIGVAA